MREEKEREEDSQCLRATQNQNAHEKCKQRMPNASREKSEKRGRREKKSGGGGAEGEQCGLLQFGVTLSRNMAWHLAVCRI